MYIHLGKDVIIKVKDIIGIFDIDKCSISKNTKQFLKDAEKQKTVFNVSYELPKSFIVCTVQKRQVVYISQISPTTLKKRMMFNDKIYISK